MFSFYLPELVSGWQLLRKSLTCIWNCNLNFLTDSRKSTAPKNTVEETAPNFNPGGLPERSNVPI